MEVKCLIIDDEPLAIEVIRNYLTQIPQMELVGTFESPIDATEVLQTEPIDLIFLDIEMPLMTGIDFVKSMQHAPKIIFITAYRHYAIESYELDVVDYLLKPISFTRFFKAVNKFKSLSQHNSPTPIPEEKAVQNDHMYVNTNKKFVKVHFNDILYVESLKDYVHIHLNTGNIITKDSISAFEQKLPDAFIRVHRSFIVNADQVSAFTKTDIEIGEKEIPIGMSYKEAVLAFLQNS